MVLKSFIWTGSSTSSLYPSFFFEILFLFLNEPDIYMKNHESFFFKKKKKKQKLFFSLAFVYAIVSYFFLNDQVLGNLCLPSLPHFLTVLSQSSNLITQLKWFSQGSPFDCQIQWIHFLILLFSLRHLLAIFYPLKRCMYDLSVLFCFSISLDVFFCLSHHYLKPSLVL